MSLQQTIEDAKISPHLPRFVALCGHPHAGKSTAQRALEQRWGYKPADDGLPIRDFAMEHCGLTRWHVYTPEGKASRVTIADREWVVRDFLGELGNRLEDLMGPQAMPHMALLAVGPEERASFGSVRRDQGAVYRAAGGIVIEIRNPLAGPSPYEFDRYDPAQVNYTIQNNALARGWHPEEALLNLREKVDQVMIQAVLDRTAAANL